MTSLSEVGWVQRDPLFLKKLMLWVVVVLFRGWKQVGFSPVPPFFSSAPAAVPHPHSSGVEES